MGVEGSPDKNGDQEPDRQTDSVLQEYPDTKPEAGPDTGPAPAAAGVVCPDSHLQRLAPKRVQTVKTRTARQAGTSAQRRVAGNDRVTFSQICGDTVIGSNADFLRTIWEAVRPPLP